VAEFDQFASSLLEEAKRFLEKSHEEADPAGKAAYLHATVILAFCAFEAHVNAIADEFSTDKQKLTLHERALLKEKDVVIKKGNFTLTDSLKMYRIIDRVFFLHQKFGRKKWNEKAKWIGDLARATSDRNRLMHPKELAPVDIKMAERTLLAVIGALDALYLTLYGTRFPPVKRGLDSKLLF
jgi:hypothetical protein